MRTTRPSQSLPARPLLAALALLLATCPAHPAEPRWFKGNTHTHSLWSDGNDFPEMITDWYRAHGYQFLAISDHNILQAKTVWMSEAAVEKRRLKLGKSTMEKYRARFGDSWVQTRETEGGREVRLRKLEEYRPLFEKSGEFILVQAEELSANYLPDGRTKVPVHINAVNLREEIKPAAAGGIVEVLRANLRLIADQERRLGIPILAHVNHPNFRWALTAEDMAEAIEERFFEIFNGHPKINYMGDATRAGNETIWDVANTLRLSRFRAPPLLGLATDDAHQYHGEESSPGRGWIMVRAAELAPEALVNAIRAGDFYASSGVTLDDVQFKNSVLRIRIRAEPGVSYTSRVLGTLKGFSTATREIPSPQGDPHPKRTAYSPEVGAVLATIEGPSVEYRLTGRELYVRAVISSTRPHPNPTFENQFEMAWTQPVGWTLPQR